MRLLDAAPDQAHQQVGVYRGVGERLQVVAALPRDHRSRSPWKLRLPHRGDLLGCDLGRRCGGWDRDVACPEAAPNCQLKNAQAVQPSFRTLSITEHREHVGPDPPPQSDISWPCPRRKSLENSYQSWRPGCRAAWLDRSLLSSGGFGASGHIPMCSAVLSGGIRPGRLRSSCLWNVLPTRRSGRLRSSRPFYPIAS